MNNDDLIPLVEPDESDPRIQSALAELRALIAARYPAADFAVYRGEDPEGIYLKAVVDVADLDEVADVFMDRLVELQVEGGLPVFVALDLPLARALAQWRERAAHRPGALLPAT